MNSTRALDARAQAKGALFGGLGAGIVNIGIVGGIWFLGVRPGRA